MSRDWGRSITRKSSTSGIMRSNQKYWLFWRRVKRSSEASGFEECWSSSWHLETTWIGARGETPWASSWRVSPGSPTPSPAATRTWLYSTSLRARARRRWAQSSLAEKIVRPRKILKYLISVPRMSFPWSRSSTHQGRCQSQVCG